ncbi:unnamed protein product [Citrullus colocynthis]|uniref:Uncharacterized protein n=1 Tax=Citrullus colocynthis TaxID=252529 RepID=A0ABP0YDB8_9ROSI
MDEAPRRVHARTSGRRPPTTAVDSGASRRWPIFLHRNSGLQGKEGCFIEEDEEKIGGRRKKSKKKWRKETPKSACNMIVRGNGQKWKNLIDRSRPMCSLSTVPGDIYIHTNTPLLHHFSPHYISAWRLLLEREERIP